MLKNGKESRRNLERLGRTSAIQTLGLEHRSLLTQYLQRYPPEISELTFANLFVWRNHRSILFAEADGSIIFFTIASQEDERTQTVLFGPPVGELSPEKVLDSVGIEVEAFARISIGTAEFLRRAGLTVEPDRANWDYVYRVMDLAELAGRRFHKKRNLVRQCLASYHCEYEPITSQLIPECREMQDRWCEARQCGVEPGLCMEYSAIREAFSHYEELHPIGGAIRVNGRIEAYAIGEELAPGTAVCHFEKAMPNVKGLGQLINQWFAKYSLGDFEFVNREQDLGIPGLRRAKESYFPHHMVEKFTARVSESVTLPELAEPHECDKHVKE